MIYDYTSIRAVHLELTDRCNAACPMCSRYTDGEESSFIQNTQLSLNDVKDIFPVQFIQQLNRINFCGNYGDPIIARDLLNVISYFKDMNRRGMQHPLRIEVNTNGSARPVVWWKILADLIGPDEANGGVWFGLDGLEDTNHLYRRNTNWDIIMRNAEAYINAGGVAHWNFIAFKHNEHQIDEARSLAKEIGFRHFNVKLTGRFETNQSFPVVVDGNHLYDLEPAEVERHQRPVFQNNPPRHDVKKILKDLRKRGVIRENKKSIPVAPRIKCVAQEEACIYVSATGHVYPCCWIGDAHNVDPQIDIAPNSISAFNHSIQSIVEGPQFLKIEDSWATGSIHKCVHFCSVKEIAGKTKYGPDYVIHERADET